MSTETLDRGVELLRSATMSLESDPQYKKMLEEKEKLLVTRHFWLVSLLVLVSCVENHKFETAFQTRHTGYEASAAGFIFLIPRCPGNLPILHVWPQALRRSRQAVAPVAPEAPAPSPSPSVKEVNQTPPAADPTVLWQKSLMLTWKMLDSRLLEKKQNPGCCVLY